METRIPAENKYTKNLLSGASFSKLYILGILTFTFCYTAWVIFWQNNLEILIIGGNLICLSGFISTFFCLFYVYKKISGNDKKFWLIILLGQAVFLSGEIIWDFYELVLKVETPYPGWPDFFYLLSPWLFIAALIYKMNKDRNKYLSLRFALDILLVMIIFAALTIQYFIYPIFFQTDVSTLYIFVSAAYPISDLGLLFGALYLWGHRHQGKMRIFYPMMCGIFLFLIADIYYLYLNSKEIYQSGGFLDLLWVVSLMLIGLSAIYHVENVKTEKIKDSLPANIPFEENSSLIYAPYFLVIMLIIMFSFKSQLNIITISSVIGIIIVMIRQNLTLLDNKELMKKLKHANEELTKLNFITEIDARTDFLTGLYNRRCIQDVIEKLIEKAQDEGQEFSVLMIDIDYFKRVNDEYGHEAGDFVLKELSVILKRNMRSKEIIGRYGGEEFIGLLPEVNKAGAKLVAERLRKEINHHDFIFDEKKIRISVSVGVSQFKMKEDQDMASVVKRADNALYEAKNKGRNRTVMA